MKWGTKREWQQAETQARTHHQLEQGRGGGARRDDKERTRGEQGEQGEWAETGKTHAMGGGPADMAQSGVMWWGERIDNGKQIGAIGAMGRWTRPMTTAGRKIGGRDVARERGSGGKEGPAREGG